MSSTPIGPKPNLPGAAPISGISGDLGDIQSFGQLVNLLKPFFAPASILTAPGATNTGGRSVAVQTGSGITTPYVISVNGQSGKVVLDLSLLIPHVYSVTAYGAVGNGLADDTAAIQDAIDAAQSDAYIGIVFFPGGTYLTSETLTITAPIVLLGEPQIGVYAPGQGSTVILATALGDDCFFFDGTAAQIVGCVVSNIQIRGVNGSAGTGANAWHFVNCEIVRMTDCSVSPGSDNVSGFDNGFLFDGTGGINCDQCSFAPPDANRSGRTGFKATALSPGNPNSCTLRDCSVSQAGQTNTRNVNGFSLADGYQSMTLVNCYSNGCINGVIMSNDGGSVPNYLVLDTMTCEGCFDGVHIAEGSPVQSVNYFGLSTVNNDIQIDSTVAPGAEIMFSNSMIGPCAGNAFEVDGAVHLSIAGGVLGVGSAIKNGVHVNGAADVTIAGVVFKHIAGASGSQGYGVWADAGASSRILVTGCTFSGIAHSSLFASSGASCTFNVRGCDLRGGGTYEIDISAAAATLYALMSGNRLTAPTGTYVNGLASPSPAGSGSTQTNTFGVDATVYYSVAGGSITGAFIVVPGGSGPIGLSGGLGIARVPAGYGIQLSYTGTLSWTWIFDE